MHLGKRLRNAAEYSRVLGNARLYKGHSEYYSAAYTPAGTRSLLEPSLQAIHADGNSSVDRAYVRHQMRPAGERLKPLIFQGDQYRLLSPHTHEAMSVLYISEDKAKAVWFSYLANNRFRAGTQTPIRLRGLLADKICRVQEVNMLPGKTSPINASVTYSDDYRMTVGLNPVVNDNRTSVVVEITEAGR